MRSHRKLKRPNLYGTISANPPAAKLKTRTTECRGDEIDQCSCLRTSPSIGWTNDGRNIGLVVIGPNMKEVLINRNDVVESVIRIINRAIRIFRRNIIKSLFAGDIRHDLKRYVILL